MTPISSPPPFEADRPLRPERAAILRQLVDVFALRPYHAPHEVAQFEEMASALAEQTDSETLTAIAATLIEHPCAPVRFLERVARLSEDARVIVYGSSHPVAQARLSAAVAWGSPKLAAAVAGRGDLDATLVAALIARPERDVSLALARNASAPLARGELVTLVARARADADLARALLPRVTGEDAAPLFLHADAPTRIAILAAVMRADLAAGPRPALRLLETDGFDAAFVAAARRDLDAVALVLAEALETRAMATRRILDDKTGEAIALLVAALALDEAQRDLLLMFLAPGDGKTVAPYERLARLAAATPQRAARRIVDAIADRKPSALAPERRSAVTTAELSARAAIGEATRRAATDVTPRREGRLFNG
jgi:uncharacterized protein (DUF2336 family)